MLTRRPLPRRWARAVSGALLGLVLPTTAGAAPDCAAQVADGPDTALLVPEQAGTGSVLLELLVDRSVTIQQVEALTGAAAASGAHLVLRVTPDAAEARAPALRQAAAAGHVLAHELDTTRHFGPDPAALRAVDSAQWRRLATDGRRRLKKLTGAPVRIVAIDVLTVGNELALDEAGVRFILPEAAADDEGHRMARGYGGQPGRGRVLPPLAYGDGCGHRMAAPTAAALNRATSAAGDRQGLRVALHPELPPALLRDWLDRALPAAGVAVVAPERLRELVARPLIQVSLAGPPPPDAPPPPPPGRMVATADLRAGAAQLATARKLPRQLPGELGLAETFAGLVLLVASPDRPGNLRLPVVRGPADVARSALPSGWQPTADEVRTAAQGLAPNLRGAVPAVVTVGDQLVAAREFLVMLADVALDQPPRARSVTDPDPFAVGAGWGP